MHLTSSKCVACSNQHPAANALQQMHGNRRPGVIYDGKLWKPLRAEFSSRCCVICCRLLSRSINNQLMRPKGHIFVCVAFPEPRWRSRSDTDMRSSVITWASSGVWESGAVDAPVHASAKLISSSCMQPKAAFVWLLLMLKNWCSFIIISSLHQRLALAAVHVHMYEWPQGQYHITLRVSHYEK